jgi:hypothetical protein
MLLLLAAVLAGCATTDALVSTDDGESQLVLAANAAQTTSGGRTQTVGLPLPPAAKIGLWSGVAVLLALAMADDSDGAAPDEGVDGP